MSDERRSGARPVKPVADVLACVSTLLCLFTLWRNSREEHVGIVAAVSASVVIVFIVYLSKRYRPVKTSKDRSADSN